MFSNTAPGTSLHSPFRSTIQTPISPLPARAGAAVARRRVFCATTTFFTQRDGTFSPASAGVSEHNTCSAHLLFLPRITPGGHDTTPPDATTFSCTRHACPPCFLCRGLTGTRLLPARAADGRCWLLPHSRRHTLRALWADAHAPHYSHRCGLLSPPRCAPHPAHHTLPPPVRLHSLCHLVVLRRWMDRLTLSLTSPSPY